MRLRWISLVLFPLVACGDGTGGDPGRIEAFVADFLTASFTGDVNGNMQVSISPDGGSTWVDLGSLNGVTIPLQLDNIRTTVHGEQSVPSDTYSQVRLTFSNVRARLNGGSSVGNTFLSSETELPLGGADDTVVIVVTVSGLEVVASETTRRSVTFSLNSNAWITEAALQAGTVDDAAIQAAVTATITTDPRS